MENEIIEETNENPAEAYANRNAEETAEEETLEEPQEVKETPKEKTDSPEQYSEREKRYYARMKQAENIAKQAREELAKVKKPTSNPEIDAILEVQEATRGLTAPEIEELKLRADALKTPLTEARKNANFQLWQKAYLEKVEKEQAALPSTTVGNVKKEKTLEEMTLDERTKVYENMGLVTKQINPRPPRQ
jgi:DNA-binding phage protein